jgi:hypothetical protein
MNEMAFHCVLRIRTAEWCLTARDAPVAQHHGNSLRSCLLRARIGMSGYAAFGQQCHANNSIFTLDFHGGPETIGGYFGDGEMGMTI